MSTIAEPYTTVDGREPSTERNMRMCFIAGRSDVPVNASILLMSSRERFPAIGIIRSHDISDGT
ncbi:hypothetical protein Tco_1024351, partial [Tanacetum coccineum]